MAKSLLQSLGGNMSNAGASDSSLVEQLKKLLIKYGDELLKPCDSTEELLIKLDRLDSVLCHTLQKYKKLVVMLLQPLKEALIADELIRHSELDVRVSAASCMCQIIRITAPDEPYGEDQMKEIFLLANSAFEMLPCMSGRGYLKAVSILHTMANTELCVMMLDLEMYAAVSHMFQLFLDGIRTGHHSAIFSSMEKIMTVTIHNTVDNDELLLVLVKILLNHLKKENQKVSPVSFQLAENTFKNCSGDLKICITEATCLDISIEDYAAVVASFFKAATGGEDMALQDFENAVSCPAEATVGNETQNPKTHEKQGMTSHSFDAQSTDKQQEQKEEGTHAEKKRNRRPNSLRKPEEGYDPFWMLVDWNSLERIPKRNKDDCPTQTKISKDLLPKDDSVKGQESSTKEVSAEKGRTTVSVDLKEDIMESSSQCRPPCSKDEAPPGRESKQNPKKGASLPSKRAACKPVGKEVVGRRIKVWWPLDKKFYRGKIMCFDEEFKLHQVDYDDGEIEFLDLTEECWKLLKDGNSSTHKQDIGGAPSSSSGAK